MGEILTPFEARFPKVEGTIAYFAENFMRFRCLTPKLARGSK